MNLRSIAHSLWQDGSDPVVHGPILAQYPEHSGGGVSGQQNEPGCVLNVQFVGFACAAGQVQSSLYALPQIVLLTVSACWSQSAREGSLPGGGALVSAGTPPSAGNPWPPEPAEHALRAQASTAITSVDTTANPERFGQHRIGRYVCEGREVGGWSMLFQPGAFSPAWVANNLGDS